MRVKLREVPTVIQSPCGTVFTTTTHSVMSDSAYTSTKSHREPELDPTLLLFNNSASQRNCGMASGVFASPTVMAVPIPWVCGRLPQTRADGHIAGLAHALFETFPCVLEARNSAHAFISPRRLWKRSLLA